MTLRWATCVAVLAILIGMARPAFAHAVLIDSMPQAGAQVMESPAEIVLTFSEAVRPIEFRVLDRAGKEAGRPNAVRLDGDTVHLLLTETLPQGSYLVTYRVTSEDTHPVMATFAFGVGEAAMVQENAAPKVSAWTPLVGTNRWVLYATMLWATGAALLALMMPLPADAARVNARFGRGAAVAAAMSFVLAVGLGGAELVGAETLLSSSAWAAGAKTTLLLSAMIGSIAMAILVIAFMRHMRALLALGAVLAIVSFTVTGHAATAAPVWVMAPSVAVHLACAAFWLAALPVLFFTAKTAEPAEAARVMTAFSIRAVWAVMALILSGVVVTVVQVGSTAAFTETLYGPRLLVKLGLFSLLLALAGYNKSVLTPALEWPEANAAWKLRRTISFELMFYVLILGAAASLTLTPPPRVLQVQQRAAVAGPFKASVTVDGYAADIEVTPGRTGRNMVMVTVRGKAGQPAALKGLDMTLALPAAGLADVEKQGEAAGPTMWHFVIDETIIAGEWQAKVRAAVTDFDYVDFEFKIPIK